jgi:hypothetical protein
MNIDLNEDPHVNALVDGSAVDVGQVILAADEQVTFSLPSGAEYDVTPKEWGFYATPSLGARLPRFNLRGALVRGVSGLHLMLVEAGKETEFGCDMAASNLTIEVWLDGGVSSASEKLGR